MSAQSPQLVVIVVVLVFFKSPFQWYITCHDGSGTLVRPDNSSNWQKVELMSGRTQVLQLFWQIFLSSTRSSWAIKTTDHSLESLLQINKDGIRTKSHLERELTEKLCRKWHSIPKCYFYKVFLSVPSPVKIWLLIHPDWFAISFPMSGLPFLWLKCFN